VIRPTVEALGTLSRGGNIGIFATQGTVSSHSYDLEIAKLYPGFKVTSMPCPMWVPLIENGEAGDPGADYFVDKYTKQLLQDAGCELDTVILGCTHYPLLYPKIRAAVPDGISVVSQGRIVAESLADYLRRHPEMDHRCSKGGSVTYLTTENPEKFGHSAGLFLNHPIKAQKITL
ncbi:MAG: aspartate/glutamate racemase family protein, partial [Candidatus Amulumruptor sp.]|nr:aspartate/glutamate racemase family protein [Candidatus Amulumruptor sp.]